jgi:hypothetical protein
MRINVILGLIRKCFFLIVAAVSFPPVVCATEDTAPEIREYSVTTVGAKGVLSVATGGDYDLDLLLSERLSWRVFEASQGDSVALLNARFTIDPGAGLSLERSQVTSFGTTTSLGDWVVYAGRHGVVFGGPRLVDGAQAIYRVNPRIKIGAWGGAAPDLFTTLPRGRLGGGVSLGYSENGVAASLVTESLFVRDGVDRLGALFQLSYDMLPALSGGSRLDIQLNDPNMPIVTDAALYGRILVSNHTRISADYQAYSSFKYLETEDLDPSIQRFEQRVVELGIVTGIPQDSMDDTIYQAAGTTVSWRAPVFREVHSSAGLSVRGRFASDIDRRYGVAALYFGVDNMLGGRLGVILDAFSRLDTNGLTGDAGVVVQLASSEDSNWSLDTSARALLNPAYGGVPGVYVDTFFDITALHGVTYSFGVYSALEHDDIVEELSFGGFLLASYRLRPSERNQAVGF